jgi:hypothetical protein
MRSTRHTPLDYLSRWVEMEGKMELLEGETTNSWDEYLLALAQQQTRRDENGRLLLPDDDDAGDIELIPEHLR